MNTYGFTNKFLTKDEKPWFPIMGEIHFSRYPAKYWKESINKMKAGGVDIISAYVIWIHHEEIENQYDFSGDRNLREFVKAIKECKSKMLLRIGPWIHGETRNGGFPDWLLQKGFQVRSNDKEYLETVKKWYKIIYDQVYDLLWSPENPDNPIVGVQIENEFGHCGGLNGEEGELHMQTLTNMAKEIGFNLPYYTATGWGGAMTGGLLPVMGGYCDAPWDQRTEKIEASGNYVFTHERNDHNIGSDYGFGEGITFDMTKFPYLTAELGGGLQVTGHRRTVATSSDIGAMSLVKLGSGVGLLGYYMYHGGTNPDGKLTTLQESRATGYLNDLPEKSYDFRAPVREFGQISDTFRELKTLAYFTKDYGPDLVQKETIIPEENPLDPSDFEHLRYSFRTNKDGGYVFVNNYVRLYDTKAHKDVELVSPEGIKLPKMDVETGAYFFLPYNIKYGNTFVKTAKVSPLCKFSVNGKDSFVFYGRKSEKEFENLFSFDENGVKDEFLVLSRSDALNAWKNEQGLFISEGEIITDENGTNQFTSKGCCNFFVYPELAKTPKGFVKKGQVNKNIAKDLPAVMFTEYEREVAQNSCDCVYVSELSKTDDKAIYKVDVSKLMATLKSASEETGINDCFVNLNYEGDSARLYAVVNGKKKLLTDHFYMGSDIPFTVGLKRYLDLDTDFSNLELEIKALKEDDKVYLETKPSFENGKLCKFTYSSFDIEYKFALN